jgi:hypothetical protein
VGPPREKEATVIHAAIDHLVVTAPSLDEGVAYIRHELGVDMLPGGAHPLMGTHNLLLSLDDSTYLEVLAVDPTAARPNHPRWFGLDELGDRDAPALAAWVARVDDIHAAVSSSSIALGKVREMSRGRLRWLIAIPQDGRGATPALIQWLSGPHPASRLAGSGCSLVSLRGWYERANPMPDFEFDRRWSAVPAGPGEPSGLEASIRTPGGLRTLRTEERP